METSIPFDDNLEKKLLSYALNDVPECQHVYKNVGINKNSFYVKENRELYNIIARRRKQKMAIEPLDIVNELESKGEINKDIIFDIMTLSADSKNIVENAHLVKQFEKIRNVMQTAQKIYQMGGVTDVDNVDNLVAMLREDVYNFLKDNTIEIDDGTIHETIDKVVEELSSGQVKPICPTGYTTLDEMIRGYGEGQLWTIAGATGQGKTTIALNLFLNAVKQKKKSAFFTIEMSKEEIIRKMLSNLSDVDYSKMCGNIQQETIDAVNNVGVKKLKAMTDSIFVVDGVSRYEDVVSRIYLLADKGCKVFFIDYIQLLSGNKQLNRQLEIGEMTSGLKRLANELKVCIVILSQISRTAGKDRADGKPTLQDLTWSSSIEHDSTVVLMLYSRYLADGPEFVEGNDRYLLEILVRKNRFGSLGDAPVFFFRDKSRVENIPDEELEAIRFSL